jgi:hypothetical protein
MLIKLAQVPQVAINPVEEVLAKVALDKVNPSKVALIRILNNVPNFSHLYGKYLSQSCR